MIKEPVAPPPVKKPRVIVSVLLLGLRGVTGLGLGALMTRELLQNPLIRDATVYAVLTFLTAFAYLTAAVLISRYKRLGLILACVLCGIELGMIVIDFLTTQETPRGLEIAVPVLISLSVFKYLTQEPEKSFFT